MFHFLCHLSIRDNFLISNVILLQSVVLLHIKKTLIIDILWVKVQFFSNRTGHEYRNNNNWTVVYTCPVPPRVPQGNPRFRPRKEELQELPPIRSIRLCRFLKRHSWLRYHASCGIDSSSKLPFFAESHLEKYFNGPNG